MERAYSERLELLVRAREIRSWRFEAIKFRLAEKTFYTPDFMVVTAEQVEFHETKGFMRDDAAVKLKVAAVLYPEFRFVLVKKDKDGWSEQEI